MRIHDVHSMSDENLLGLAEQIIANIQSSPLITQRLAEVNVGADHFATGRQIVDTFRPLVRAVPDLAGQTNTTISERDETAEAFRTGLLRRHVQTARLVFQDRSGDRQRLGLDRLLDPRQSLDEFVEGTGSFYARIDAAPALKTAMAERGYTDEDAAEGQAVLARITSLDQQYSQLLAERQQAVRSRDAYRPAVVDWVRDTQRWAQVVLDDRPDLLEQLGFVVPSN
jgi:hypothetical protein